MSEKSWAYEDFEEGSSIPLGSKLVTAEEIIEFAGEFDPQPFHLDEEAGRASILGGLSASGWHTSCIFMRLLCDGFLLELDFGGVAGCGSGTVEEAGACRQHAYRPKHGACQARIAVAPQSGHRHFSS